MLNPKEINVRKFLKYAPTFAVHPEIIAVIIK